MAARPHVLAGSSSSTPVTGIGIDLGTTYSCVAIWKIDGVEIIPNDQGNRTTPSCVAFTENVHLVGDAAKNQAVSNPANTIFDAKRMIGRAFSEEVLQQDMKFWCFNVVAGPKDKPMVEVTHKGQKKFLFPEEISSIVLCKMKEIAETYLGYEVKNAVITVPAYFNDAQRRATRDAGMIAGLNVKQIINEPTAAALAYGFDKQKDSFRKPKNVVVFDFGGGTLDVSALVIDRGVIEAKAVAGNTHLGGQDIDENMIRHFAQEFQKKYGKDVLKSGKAIGRLRAASERVKRTLSSAVQAEIDLDGLYEGIDFQASISRAKFEDLNSEIFKKCMEPLRKCLEDANIDKRDIDDVVLVGGSTRIPKIQSLLREFFGGKDLCSSIHPDEAVAYGAAIQAAAMCGWDGKNGGDYLLLDVTPLSLGTDVRGDIMVTVIKRNTTIPCKMETMFCTTADNQRVMNIKVYEGERSMASDNNLLGEFNLEGLEPKPKGEVEVMVTFEIDANGILTVSAKDYRTGRTAMINITNDKGRLTAEQINEMMMNAEKYRMEDEERKKIVLAKLELEEYLYQLRKILANEEVVSKLDPAKKRELQEIIGGTRDWSQRNEYVADASQYRSRKSSLENIWKGIFAALQVTGIASSIARIFM